jgi:pantoate--beta-alanine ligase
MSSRNSYITEDERPRVTVLKQSLEWIAEQIHGGSKDFFDLEQSAGQRLIDAGFKVDYVTISNSKTLDPAADDDVEITILGAMFTDKARLIDNLSIVLN